VIARKEAERLLDEMIDAIATREAEMGDYLNGAEVRGVATSLVRKSVLVQRGVENVEQKARRYLTEGRLRVERFRDDGLIVASCRGTDQTYRLGYDPTRREWRCTCTVEHGGSRRRRCAHIAALQLVVERPT
jgi:hypothetical protein